MRQLWSRAICQHLSGVIPVDAVVMTYVAIRSEVELAPLVATRRAGMTVLPRVEGDRLVAALSDTELVVSSFGVPEPAGEPVDLASIDVVCLPGLAFDRDGRRLGYGAGFYDRFLPLLRPDTLTIGVGFSVQLVDEVPVDSHDRLVDLIVTEEGVIGGRSSSD
jgi:5-formyltetrahydrofolate cyclo-ligase